MGLQQASILYKDHLYPHYYLCRYLPVSAGKDSLSHSLLKFKRGRQPDLDTWIDCSLEMLQTPPAPPHSNRIPLDCNRIPQNSDSIPPDSATVSPDIQNSKSKVQNNQIIPPDSFIVRALHHEETLLPQHPQTSLDKLGSALARHFDCHYHPRLLRKSFPIKESKGLTREQRRAGLQDLYTIDKTQLLIAQTPISGQSISQTPMSPIPGPFIPPVIPSPDLSIPTSSDASIPYLPDTPTGPTFTDTPPPSFLLIDDILTTGATMRMIIGAILQVYPAANLTLFTLAKAVTF